jgi:hypothetical protein
MRRRRMRQTIVHFVEANGDELRCPVIFETDYGFQTHNRMVLLGSQENQHKLLHFVGSGEVKWRIPPRPDDYYETTGKCWFLSVGATEGVGLERDTPQPIGDAQILELTETVRHSDINLVHRQVGFLQRPKYWPIGGVSWKRPFGEPRTGRWQRIRNHNLRLRGVMHEFHREGPTPASEMELIQYPGIEFEPLDTASDATDLFLKLSERAWFACRSLLMFYLRQHIDEFLITTAREGERSITTHAVEILPRDLRENGPGDRPVGGIKIEAFLATSLSRVFSAELDLELLHASSFGYADSYRQASGEGGITSVTEAIERLLTLYEQSKEMDRGILTPAEQRKLAKALKLAVDKVVVDPGRRALIKSAVSARQNLTLEQRIRRMAKSQRRSWTKPDLEYLDGLENLIKVRNDLVHGRKVSDQSQIHAELGRARAIYEKLFLCFLGCGRATISHWALMALKHHYKNSSPSV